MARLLWMQVFERVADEGWLCRRCTRQENAAALAAYTAS